MHTPKSVWIVIDIYKNKAIFKKKNFQKASSI